METKYEIWKEIALKWYTEQFEEYRRDIILIHNQTKNTLYTYSINKRKKAFSYYKRGFEFMLTHYLPQMLTVETLEPFYLSLPRRYKNQFWELLYTQINNYIIRK